MRAWVLMLAMATGSDAAQDKKAPGEARPKVDQARVDAAIKKGLDYLRGKQYGAHTEIVLWTFVHAGVPETDPEVKAFLQVVLSQPPPGTYRTSLRAMILEELDRVKYQEEIWKCAQFLIDNMDPFGQWGYGEATTYAQPVPTAAPKRKDVATSAARKPKATSGNKASGPAERVKPPVVRYLSVKKQREGSGSDNSNTQYAALGLRACHDAGILLPENVVQKARQWWVDDQVDSAPAANGDTATSGRGEPPAGWGYYNKKRPGVFGSMTVGGVGSVAIYDYLLGIEWKRDPVVLRGAEWIARNFSVKDNPGRGSTFHYYYLYGLERAGILCGTEWFGKHEWYPEGVNFLLDDQKADGSWGTRQTSGLETYVDTCFAILFLRRATRPLPDVASVDRFVPKR